MSPTTPGTPCPHAGCPEITPPGEHCDEHRSEQWRRDDRPSASERGYDRAWEKVRRAHLRMEPLCRNCEERGRVEPASEVDHIVPLSEGGARLDHDNLQSLCRPCHNRKTARERTA